MPPPREPSSRRNRRREPMPGGWLWVFIMISIIGIMIVSVGMSGSGGMDYSSFLKLAQDGKFSKVVLKGEETAVGTLSPDAVKEIDEVTKKYVRSGKLIETNIPKAESRGGITEKLDRYKVQYTSENDVGSWIGPTIIYLIPTLILIAFFVFVLLPRFRNPMGGGFLSQYVKSPAKRYEKGAKARTTFADVADMTAAKSELVEVVDFLKSPEKYQKLGAQIPKGVLLIGPPGTGKTLLARAVAGEAGVPFYSISGSEFIQMFVGVGASRVRDLFKTAKENSPCLIFIDEIDAVGRMRGAGVGGGSDEREQTLNQILSEMDGFNPTESVIVVAATNRPDVLDSALLRPGRFDRHVTIDRPTWQGRFEILKVHTRNKPLADDVDLEGLARKMIGMTGADLRNLANEAALLAARENKTRIERKDFENASDRVLLGAKREDILTEDDKRRTAYHEAGHAIVAYFDPAGDPPSKISIVPRGQSGGVTMFNPEEERHHYGMDYFKARLAAMMGGRAAERLKFGQPFAGVESDLKQATKTARYMVTHWGMSERLGPMSFRVGEEHVFLGKEIQENRDFSETTAAVIDQEVQKLLREADERAYSILEEHRDIMERMVNELLQREELLREEIDAILGLPRPTAPGANGVLGGTAKTPVAE